jgi:hypothetical protein
MGPATNSYRSLEPTLVETALKTVPKA